MKAVADSKPPGLAVGWIRLPSFSSIGPIRSAPPLPRVEDELHWVYQQLNLVIDAHCFDLIMPSDGFNAVSPTAKVLRRAIGSQATSLPAEGRPSIIVLASANRSDPIEEAVAELNRHYPNVAIQPVLGEWWAGHRRAWPLATELPAAYWYQCCDKLIPDLIDMRSGSSMSRSKLDRVALAVSHDSSIRQMWLDVLPALGFQPLATRVTENLPEGQIDVVLYDVDRVFGGLETELPVEDSREREWHSAQINILRHTYPQSRIGICTGFPRWQELQQWSKSGADFLVGKPFRLEGLGSWLTAIGDRLS